MSQLNTARTQINSAFNQLLENVDSIEKLEEICSAVGLELEFVVKSNNKTTARANNYSKGKGARGYWKTIKRIAKKNGVSQQEARKIYSKQKAA